MPRESSVLRQSARQPDRQRSRDIRSDGSLTGEVVAARISIEDGAYFKGGIDIRKGGQPTQRRTQSKPNGRMKASRRPSPRRRRARVSRYTGFRGFGERSAAEFAGTANVRRSVVLRMRYSAVLLSRSNKLPRCCRTVPGVSTRVTHRISWFGHPGLFNSVAPRDHPEFLNGEVRFDGFEPELPDFLDLFLYFGLFGTRADAAVGRLPQRLI